MKKGQTSKLFNSNINLSLSAFGVSLFAMFTSATLLSLPSTHAETTVTSATTSANASVTVPSACTLSGGGNSYSAEMTGGTTVEFGGTSDEGVTYPGTPIKATCNDPNGYALYAIGYSGHNYTTPTNNQLIATNTGSSNNISTGTSGSNSYWAFKLAPVTGTYAPTVISPYTAYSNIPATYAKVAQFPSATDLGSSATGSAIKAYYEVHLSSSQAPDTYTGAVKYTLVHPSTEPAPWVPTPVEPTAGYISYNPNFKDLTDSMGDQSVASNATSANLWASNFINPTGYGFAGWNTEPDYTGTSYGPNETISDTTVISNIKSTGLSLYAIWVPSNGNSLQGWTGCSALTKANEATDILSQSITALTDQRDQQTYAVARLADGNCWMIENLRLDNDPVNPNWGDNNLSQGFGGVFIGLANPENTLNWTTSTTANSLYSTDGSTSAPAITGSYQGYRFPRYNNQNTATPDANMTGGSANIYSYGNYYTWSAAIADTSNYTSGTHADTSICPKGWHMPYGNNGTGTGGGNTSGGFYYLGDRLGATTSSAASSNIWRSYPNNFIYAGYFLGGSAGTRGSRGYYWSSTVSNYSSYRLYLVSSSVSPGTDSYYKFDGPSVRCLAQ